MLQLIGIEPLQHLLRLVDVAVSDRGQWFRGKLGYRDGRLATLYAERLGVDVIEAGFPIASNGDFEAVREIGRVIKKSTIAGLSRANRRDIDRDGDAPARVRHVLRGRDAAALPHAAAGVGARRGARLPR